MFIIIIIVIIAYIIFYYDHNVFSLKILPINVHTTVK
jgi:hypothetical protein